VPQLHGVRALPDGAYGIRLETEERQLLIRLAAELEHLVEAQDAVVARLFPPAYRDDPQAEEEYRRLLGDSLAAGRLETLRLLRTTARSDRLSQAEADAWCSALNDLRLVFGEQLDVTEELAERGIDPDHPNAVALSIYGWLTWLQSEVVEALASRLD
jgi:hypothetical protein